MKKIKFDEISRAMKYAWRKAYHWASAHKPELYLVGAGAAGVGAVVTAYKAGDKVKSAKATSEANVLELNNMELTQEEYQKALRKLKVKEALSYGVIWLPTVALGATSGYLTYKSYRIMKTDIHDLKEEVTSLITENTKYRNEVVKKFGEDVDKELLSAAFGGMLKEFEHEVVDEETGEVKTVKETVEVINPNNLPCNMYLFSRDISYASENNYNYDYTWCKMQVAYMNDTLNAEGIFTTHDAQQSFGIARDPALKDSGWRKPQSNHVNVVLTKVYIGDPALPYDGSMYRVLIKMYPDYLDVWNEKAKSVRELAANE